MEWLIVSAAAIILGFGYYWGKNSAEKQVISQAELIKTQTEEVQKKVQSLLVVYNKEFEDRKKEIETISKEKAIGFPWLAEAYGDYFELKGLIQAEVLDRKKRPAESSADKVREISRDRREAEKKYRVTNYVLEMYENLFPWLKEFRDEEVDELLIKITEGEQEESEDPARHWLAPEEFKSLPNEKKFQLALDRYWTKKKTKWEIGRDYERFVGYKYETAGFSVNYHGIIKGFEDIGRDLIATKGNQIEVIQCKYWRKERIIHEKHIFQLFGTVTAFRIDNPGKKVTGKFITTTTLSDTAKKFAKALDISYEEQYAFVKYPSIKCNISGRNKEKIYHLPFDQQYDRTQILEEKLEKYVETVAEAEKQGFRRAFRWHGAETQ